MNEIEPVRVPKDVLEGLEAVRRYARTDVLDIATVRYLGQERGQGALVIWIDEHPQENTRTQVPCPAHQWRGEFEL